MFEKNSCVTGGCMGESAAVADLLYFIFVRRRDILLSYRFIIAAEVPACSRPAVADVCRGAH